MPDKLSLCGSQLPLGQEQKLPSIGDNVLAASALKWARRPHHDQGLACFLVDTKRARDTDMAALTMQMLTWRDGRAANEAFVAGSGDALRTWRQP